MSPEFFDAERYPQAKFSSTELDVEDDGTVRLEGDLEIRGETRRGRRDRQVRRSSAPTSAAPSASASRSRPRSIAATSASSFNAELPSGGKVLEYEVAINVELELVAAESE